jgi:hypothetical protein
MANKPISVIKAIDSRVQEKRFLRSQDSKLGKVEKRRRAIAHTIEEKGKSKKSRFELDNKLPGIAKDDAYKDILIPSVLDLTKPKDETLELIRDIRKIVLKRKSPLRLVFDEAKDIQPASLLLLLAEIHRCRLIHGQSILTGTYPKKGSKLEKVMHATGFFKLLGVKSQIKKAPKRFPVDYIEFISDIRPPKDLSKQFRKALFGEEIQLDLKIRHQLVRAIGEAVVNVGQHAYPKNSHHEHPSKGRWWLSGHVDKKNALLTITFCDLGVGIPETLPKRYAMEIILSMLALLPGIKPNDGQMIKAGMEIGRSRTLQTHRGKGLNDLRRIIDVAGEGELHILSRRGCYRYSPGKEDVVRNLDMTVGGTLIKWTIPLNKITDWESVGGEQDDNNQGN